MSQDETIRYWDTMTGKELKVLGKGKPGCTDHHTSTIYCVKVRNKGT